MLFQSSLGIHIEEDRLGMVVLKSSFRGILLADQLSVSLAGFPSQEERMQALCSHIKTFLEKNQVPSSVEIYMAIPRREVLSRMIELPSAARENLRETVGYEMEKFTPFAADAVYFDARVLQEEREDGQMRVFLMVVRKKAAEPYVDLMKKIGWGLSGMEILSSALVNYVAVEKDVPGVRERMILFAGEGYLEGDLLQKNQLVFSKAVAPEGGGREAFMENTDAVISELRDKTPEGTPAPLLCVGEPFDEGVLRELAEKWHVRVEGVNAAAGGLLPPSLVPAYGLALKGVRKVPLNVNFLPRELRKKASRTAYYALFILSFLVVLFTAAWLGSAVIHQKLLMDRLNGELESVTKDVRRIERLHDKVKVLEGKVDFLNGIVSNRVQLLNIMKEITGILPETAWVQRFSLSSNTIEIEGYADTTSDLIPLLEASPRFRDAAFLSPITKGRDGKERFRIGLKIR